MTKAEFIFPFMHDTIRACVSSHDMLASDWMPSSQGDVHSCVNQSDADVER